ncbi:MAG: STAS domain-containing protein, partial [Acidobacteriota bacterium]
LDLSRVQRIDSSGIGELASGLRLAERFGSSMRLLNVDGQVLRILELSQLLPLFQVHGDEDEAIAAFDRASSSTASTVFDES